METVGIPHRIPLIDDCLDSSHSDNRPCLAGMLYFGGAAAYVLGGAMSYYNQFLGSIAVLDLGSVCLHANIRGAIHNHIPYATRGDPDIEGENNSLANFCCAWCCYSCALAQEQRELVSMLSATAYKANHVRNQQYQRHYDDDNGQNYYDGGQPGPQQPPPPGQQWQPQQPYDGGGPENQMRMS